MLNLFSDLTRSEISDLATDALAVVPTASIEQHGPHLAVVTDTLLVTAVSRQSAEKAMCSVVVAPTVCYGNSHHHRPHPGVLSLQSDSYLASLRDVIEGLSLSGYRRILLLNGHGGNTAANQVAVKDAVNRYDLPGESHAAAYWDVARSELVTNGLANEIIPGHAGHFETSMVMALRPDLVRNEVLANLPPVDNQKVGLLAGSPGTVSEQNRVWGSGPGYSDDPASATPEKGMTYMQIIIEKVSRLYESICRNTIPTT